MSAMLHRVSRPYRYDEYLLFVSRFIFIVPNRGRKILNCMVTFKAILMKFQVFELIQTCINLVKSKESSVKCGVHILTNYFNC